MKELKTKLNDAINSLIYPPLILAIKIKDIPEKEIKKTEYVIYESINADKLFIYKEGNNTYTPLLSEQGNSYVVEIKRLIELNKSKNTKLKEEQEEQENLEKLQRLEELYIKYITEVKSNIKYITEVKDNYNNFSKKDIRYLHY
jgi:hypothetical protein